MVADSRLTRETFAEIYDTHGAQQRLPYWSRSTNPIVRRHLGLYWRTVPPDLQPFANILLVWSVLFGIGVVFPPFVGFVLITFLAALIIVPIALVVYGHILLTVATAAAQHMQSEIQNNTFNLLRTTPMTLHQIMLGKVAAALWKRMDDIVLIAQVVVVASPPLIFTLYSELLPLDGGGRILTPLLTLIGTVVIGLRIILEPLMIGTLAVFVGLVVPGRSRAITTAVALGAFYFLLLNLTSRLPFVRGAETASGGIIEPSLMWILLFDLVLPIALPILITWVLLQLGQRIIVSDQ